MWAQGNAIGLDLINDNDGISIADIEVSRVAAGTAAGDEEGVSWGVVNAKPRATGVRMNSAADGAGIELASAEMRVEL